MKTQSKKSSWSIYAVSFWLTLLPAIGIIFIGLRFIISPQTGADGFGIALSKNAAAYGAIKGIRDIFSGVVLLPFLWKKDANTTAIILGTTSIVPLTDCCLIFLHNGISDSSHLLIHGTTALYLIILSVYLWNFSKKSGTN